jgi:hypothetical protein
MLNIAMSFPLLFSFYVGRTDVSPRAAKKHPPSWVAFA